MNYLQRIVLILVLASFAVGSVQAQKKKRKKAATEKKTAAKKKSSNARKTVVAKPVQPKEIKSATVTKLEKSATITPVASRTGVYENAKCASLSPFPRSRNNLMSSW